MRNYSKITEVKKYIFTGVSYTLLAIVYFVIGYDTVAAIHNRKILKKLERELWDDALGIALEEETNIV
jgi:hypothetical protein